MRTVFTVRNPSPNPFDPLQGTVISNCGRDLAGWNGRDDNFNLRNGLTQGNGAYSLALAQTFHRWQNLCSAGIPVQPGDYSIQVQTPSGGSQNRLALRATHSAGNDEVSIFAAGRVSLYLNTPANTTSNFNMVRLDSSTARHTLVVRFFDFGDVGSGTVDVTLKTAGQLDVDRFELLRLRSLSGRLRCDGIDVQRQRDEGLDARWSLAGGAHPHPVGLPLQRRGRPEQVLGRGVDQKQRG